MKVALVHDYIKEFGGAERVLLTLHGMFPEAPIYTAFVTPGSTCERVFVDAGAKLIPSWANVLLRQGNLHSPLRFLIPMIWESFDFSKFDLVILSTSSYVTKPVGIPKNVRVICYCHTPPRYVWGYDVSAEWSRYPVLKFGSEVLAYFLRIYDRMGAKRVDQFVANSKTVAERIKKNYGKESVVIFPPVDVKRIEEESNIQEKLGPQHSEDRKIPAQQGSYFLVVSRIIGGKGIPIIMEAYNSLSLEIKSKYKLLIAGKSTGLQWEGRRIGAQKSEEIEFLGEASEEEKIKLMVGAKAFVAAERNVDFGITPVEAMAAGVPVVAFKSGGYLETVVEGKTGTFFEKYDPHGLAEAMKRVLDLRFKREDLRKQAEKFSKEKFILAMKKLISETDADEKV